MLNPTSYHFVCEVVSWLCVQNGAGWKKPAVFVIDEEIILRVSGKTNGKTMRKKKKGETIGVEKVCRAFVERTEQIVV